MYCKLVENVIAFLSIQQLTVNVTSSKLGLNFDILRSDLYWSLFQRVIHFFQIENWQLLQVGLFWFNLSIKGMTVFATFSNVWLGFFQPKN